ncbi:MAG TPA: SRPBCC domain-containing protein [candidate division Zixibacteria bacterium]|nr:SRPBCC domain-containing protein [candidate division Zixibacteria bacterium]
MKEIRTEIVVNASLKDVWRTLIDFHAFPEWNPFITEISGEIRVGAKLRIQARLSDKRAMVFKPKILRCSPDEELRWLGRLMLPGLFDGEHQFRLESIAPDKTRFLHSERFSGVLVPILWGMIGPDTESGFHKMNEALKQRVERRDSSG